MNPPALPRLSLATLAVALTAMLHTPAFADAPGDGSPAGAHWGLGMVVRSETKAYRDFDNKTEVWPVLTFENRWVRFFGPSMEVKLGQSGAFAFGLNASYAGDGYEAKDSPFLAGMKERKNSFWLGGSLSMRHEMATFNTRWVTDASGNSHGQKLKLGVERRFALGQLGITPRLAATWQDSKFVNYYYGVRASEIRSGRAAYNAGSAVNAEVGLRLDYRLARQHMLFVDMGVTALDNAIKNSPLVDRGTVPEVGIGYMYRF
ncbi:hypothetical protein LPB72_04985 [Hydrogenophaga crassostreae]|uniref:Structural protein MipA n=1 Tax=Hydrogenophaga crassostreae TaxID=1763535 RepID=A0A167IMR5_9BURK|nr:MipA/OmpV family protein [Hydrogenophaga crassostreae]AOW14697.1 hypothetical protein LPB072_19565 [Hydrogenophaga crassostreae]OAD43207.1 hypothetical protein LPB72_04985 [Hydrogenophaga crassostreae]